MGRRAGVAQGRAVDRARLQPEPAPVMDYSVAAQGPIEDLANAVQGLAGDEAPHVVRARDLVRGAITKLKEGRMTDEKAGPTCGSCGAPVTVTRVGAKGRAKQQLLLKCTDKECGSRA